MMMRIEDLICNRCEGVYKNNDKTLAVFYSHCYFSICPKCTKEVTELMGYTEETLMKILSGMKRAETENNRKLELKEGVCCYKCEEKFIRDEPRVKVDDCSNTKAYHIDCYELE